jgi:hypothetical protein
MPEIQEVFRMATQKVRPEPGALERQFRDQRRHVAKQKVGVFALVAVLIIAGVLVGVSVMDRDEQRPANPPKEQTPPVGPVEGSPPTVEQLTGIWYDDPGTGSVGEPVMFWFGPDGSFSHGGVLSSDSWLTGTYEVDGHRITVDVTGGFCGGGYAMPFDAGIVSGGRLEAVFRGIQGDQDPEAVGECTLPVGEPYGLTQVSPASPAAAAVTARYHASTSITAETNPVDLQGIWLVEGTGYLLRLDWSGAYRLDDGGELGSNPDDVGRVEFGSSTLTFTSGTGGQGCAAGDVMRWENVRWEDGVLRGTVSEDGCGRDIGSDAALLFLDVFTP